MVSFATQTEGLEVLLVEDSPGDVRLTREALKDAKVRINLHVARDGEEAMAFLRREGKYDAVPRPDLIFLDLNLPRKSGWEVLEEIKRDSTLMSIPVFVLTTSVSEQDVQRSYLHHANCFITKPVGLEGFLTVVKSIDSFWLTVVKLPTREAQERERRPGVEPDPGDARLSLSE
jgi:CheY-like chemotaxis protein